MFVSAVRWLLKHSFKLEICGVVAVILGHSPCGQGSIHRKARIFFFKLEIRIAKQAEELTHELTKS